MKLGISLLACHIGTRHLRYILGWSHQALTIRPSFLIRRNWLLISGDCELLILALQTGFSRFNSLDAARKWSPSIIGASKTMASTSWSGSIPFRLNITK